MPTQASLLSASTEAAPQQLPALGATGHPIVRMPRDGPVLRWASVGLVVLSAAIFFGALFVAGVHVDDRYRIDPASGARVALAQYFNDGTLYPELHDGQFYGGTRFMPLPLVLHGLAARVTGEYLTSGRLLSYATMAALFVMIFALLRRMRCPFPIAMGLGAMVLVTKTGLGATMSLRADTLPLLLQLGALTLVGNTGRTAGTVAASMFAALALVSKLSAIWAPLAIVMWLFFVDRRRLVWFTIPYIAFAAFLLTLFGVVSDGRMFQNVFGLATAGVGGAASIITAPYRFISLAVGQATAAWALFALVPPLAWVWLKKGEVSLYLLSLMCGLAVLIVVLTDIGTGWNQLVDPVVLLALVLGEFAGRPWFESTAKALVTGGLTFILLWVDLTGLVTTLTPEAKVAAMSIRQPHLYDKRPLSEVASPTTTLLAEDPYLPASLGQTPVVLDPFMLLRIGRRDPAAVRPLIDRIEKQEFELVALVVELEPINTEWWRELHFGLDVVKALERSYAYTGRIDGYYVYKPREARDTDKEGWRQKEG